MQYKEDKEDRKMRFVAELPKAIRDELLKDSAEILGAMGLDEKEIKEAICNVADSKLRDVIGNTDEGLADFDKYKEWLKDDVSLFRGMATECARVKLKMMAEHGEISTQTEYERYSEIIDRYCTPEAYMPIV